MRIFPILLLISFLLINNLTIYPMQILTMEYVPGIKINKIQALDQLGVDRQRLIESFYFSFLLGKITIDTLPFTSVHRNN